MKDTKLTPAQTVRILRIQQTGLSQAAFADQYQIPKRTIENWESGKTTPPPYVLAMLTAIIMNRITY